MELSLALEKPCYFPGEVLKCLIKVRRTGDAAAAAAAAAVVAGDGSAEVLQLLFECSGSERVDPSWVGQLYKPEVTAIKDHKRLVRSIFSTGQVPLLQQGDSQALAGPREFVVRCRLPTKLPPSYRGNAVRFVYQAVVQARLLPGGTNTSTQQPQQQVISTCQAPSSFVVWPVAERGSGLERRSSLQLQQQQPGQPSSAAAAAAGAAGNAAAAAAAAGAADVSLQDVDMIDYKLGMQVSKLRWEEVLLHADGTRTLMSHTPSCQLYPGLRSRSSAASQLLAGQLCHLDSLLLDDQQAAAVAAAAAGGSGGAGGDGEGEGDDGGLLRHLTPAQRASGAVRTFNLRAGDFPLLRLVLQPPADGLQPGSTLGLLLDFRAAHAAPPGSSQQPVCLQVVALLESEEVVLSPHTHGRSSDSAAMRKLYSEQQEVTAHLLSSQFVFSIPLTAPPSFKTPMVSHRWVLRFELTLGKPKPHRPGELLTEQLLWSLPLVVFPPPLQGSAGI
ncbi:hypothetical protein OEZ86_014682 [Tetradesmus obliquus]|nr:hypothetical protein OEZ86_014682 [Tetradesmus obliquus]